MKFSKISIKKGHTGACVALEFKAFHAEKDIPLGCFFFRGDDEGPGLDMGTFLDSESLMLLLENLFQDAMVCFSSYDSFELFLKIQFNSKHLKFVPNFFLFEKKAQI